MATKQHNSMALYRFNKRMVTESQTYWYMSAAVQYAERWLRTIPDKDKMKTVSEYPGDRKDPFWRVGGTPNDFITAGQQYLSSVRENTIIAFATTFENYLYDTMKRAIYIEPELMNDSDIKIDAKIICTEIKEENAREWFSSIVAEKYLRNKSHTEMVLRLNTMLKLGLKEDSPELVDWKSCDLLRNSIIHLARTVSADLHKVKPLRFPEVGAGLDLTDHDITFVSTSAQKLASRIDSRFCSALVKDADAELLLRELFVRDGKSDVGELRNIVLRVTGVSYTPYQISHILAVQRRTNSEVSGFDFRGIP